MTPIVFTDSPSLDLFAFPLSKAGVAVGSLANWNSVRVPVTRAASPNNGRYSVNLDESVADVWLIFIGDVQPASFDEAIRELSDVGVVAGGGGGGTTGSGQHAVAVTIKTGATTPVQNAKVSVIQSGSIVAWGYTSQIGQLSFALNAGSYTVNVSAPGFDSLTNQSMVVTTASSFTFTLTPETITPPPTTGLCRIAVTVRESDQTVAGVDVTAKLTDKQSTIRAGISVLIVDKATTDENGYCELLLPWTSEFTAGTGYYTIEARDSGSNSLFHRRAVIIPNQSTAQYGNLVTAPTAD